MTVGLAEANKALVVKMFREVGDKEFVIIERSGGYFGFIFGVFQMIIFYIVDVYEPEYSGPLLPVFGFMVGWLTNWVALKLIFRPIEPTPVCCGAFVIQGAFLKRQEAVSEKFAALNAELFCNAHNIWDEMMHGAKKEQFNAMIKKHATTFFDRTVGGSGAMVAKTLFGKETFERVRGGVADGLSQAAAVDTAHLVRLPGRGAPHRGHRERGDAGAPARGVRGGVTSGVRRGRDQAHLRRRRPRGRSSGWRSTRSSSRREPRRAEGGGG